MAERRTTLQLPVKDLTPSLIACRDRRDVDHREVLVQRLQAHFREVPGLCVTPVEASRIFGLAPDVCGRVLSALVEDGLLAMRADGRYVHRPTGA